jgi:micrococcal nuclease
MKPRAAFGIFCAAFAVLASACADEAPHCGPPQARVRRVVDGDTLVLDSGERVRVLLVDAPEDTSDEPACFGPEATRFSSGQQLEEDRGRADRRDL